MYDYYLYLVIVSYDGVIIVLVKSHHTADAFTFW